MKKKFNLTENFTTPEILNKYRHSDKNLEDKIKKNEKIKEKYENLDKIINKSIDKLKTKPKKILQPIMIMMMMIVVLVFYIKPNMIIMILIQKYVNRIIDLIMMMKY